VLKEFIAQKSRFCADGSGTSENSIEERNVILYH
jgi:hypothetical protein